MPECVCECVFSILIFRIKRISAYRFSRPNSSAGGEQQQQGAGCGLAVGDAGQAGSTNEFFSCAVWIN